jgi:DeoR/GlpR family transcriptional regulator of sugar metabolism
MNQRRRLKEIADYLGQNSELTVSQACDLFKVSPATIRRDFNALLKKKEVEKTWGGIAPLEGKGNGHDAKDVSMAPVSVRQTLHAKEKQAIAERAAAYVEDGDVIIIDGGTTTYFMTKHLANKKIQVITNSILIAHQIDNERQSRIGAEVFVTGGLIYPEAGLLVGPQSIANIKEYHAKWAFLSVGGIEADQATNSSQLVVETERAIMEQSQKIVMLADHSKIGKRSMCRMCSINEIDLVITDYYEPNEPVLNQIRELGVEVVDVK